MPSDPLQNSSAVTILCNLIVPPTSSLIGMLMFGNLIREVGIVERLSKTAQNALITVVTISRKSGAA